MGPAISIGAPSLFQSVNASVQVPQTALPGANITQYVTSLTRLSGRRVTCSSVDVRMHGSRQHLLPDLLYGSLAAPRVRRAIGMREPEPAQLHPGSDIFKETRPTASQLSSNPAVNSRKPETSLSNRFISKLQPHLSGMFTGMITFQVLTTSM